MIGTHAIKVRFPNERRWAFVTSNGGTNHLRIHAALYTEDKASAVAEMIETDNPGVKAKVVSYWPEDKAT